LNVTSGYKQHKGMRIVTNNFGYRLLFMLLVAASSLRINLIRLAANRKMLIVDGN